MFKRHEVGKPINKLEEEQSREPLAIVIIDLARHSTKTDNDAQDEKVPLSSEGVKKVIKSGQENELRDETNIQTSSDNFPRIFDSGRDRTGQASFLRMFAERFKDVDLTNVGPQELLEWFKQSGLEVISSRLLDFHVEEGEYKDKFYEAYYAKELMKFMVEKSDEFAIQSKVKSAENSTLSTSAGNIATFVYLLGKGKAAELLSNDSDSKVNIDFATSHQTVLESFLYKAVLLNRGEEDAHKFLQEMGPQGFEENQGFQIEYQVFDDKGEDWVIKINFSGEEYELNEEDLVKIIHQGEEVRDKIRQQNLQE